MQREEEGLETGNICCVCAFMCSQAGQPQQAAPRGVLGDSKRLSQGMGLRDLAQLLRRL